MHLKPAGRARPLNRFKIYVDPNHCRRTTTVGNRRVAVLPLESDPKFIMSCANVQSVANICAPRRFTNAGTHRALPRSIDITPLTQATVPSMKHNHFISRTAAFSAARPRSKSNGRCVYKEILSINTLFILHSFQFRVSVILAC